MNALPVFGGTGSAGERHSGTPPRDVRVVEGARLESEAGDGHQGSSKRLNTHAISGLMGLIRFGGHLSKGEYDVHTDGRDDQKPAGPPAVR